MRRSMTTLLLIVAMLVMAAVPAFAQGYGEVEPSAGATDTTVVAGESTTICGEDWQPGSTVTITFRGEVLGTASVDGAGEFCTTVTLPEGTPPGDYVLGISGFGPDGEPQTVSLRVVVAGTGSGPTLPDTDTDGGVGGTGDGLADTGGAFTVGSAVIALVSFMLGGTALAVARRRRTPTEA